MERPDVAVVIPAFNEAQTIVSVISPLIGKYQVIVVDDASSDGTLEAVSGAGVCVFRHEKNGGYDDSVSTGFHEAALLGCSYVVTMDADGQHDAGLIGSVVASLENGASLVVGIRPRTQRFSEKIFAWVTFTKFGVRDPLSGFKGYRMEMYQQLGHFDSYRSIGTEMLLYAASQKLEITQMPIPIRPRIGSPRFGNTLRANIKILRALMIGLFRYRK